jgi:K+ transporter
MSNITESSTYRALEKRINDVKSIWWQIVLNLIWVSLVALFISSFIFHQEIQLVTINGWVSLILGLVATFLSIISTFLSFYNLEKTNESNKENTEIMKQLQKSIEDKIYELPARTAEAVSKSQLSQNKVGIKSTKDDTFDDDELPF